MIRLFACAALLGSPSGPLPEAAAAVDDGAPISIGTSYTLDSRVLGAQRKVHVCLPMGYAERKQAFPVVYLIDGGVQQDLIPVAGFGTLATLSGQYEEFILVGVETVDRRFELTAPSKVPYDLSVLPRNGGAADFRRFLVEEVKPFVEGRFRTSGEDALLGESLAGLFIVETCLEASVSFDHYIAISPSVWWKEEALARAAPVLLGAPDFAEDRTLYLSVADEADIQKGLKPIVAALEEHAPKSLTWWFEPLPEEHHHTIYHPATLNALRRVFATEH